MSNKPGRPVRPLRPRRNGQMGVTFGWAADLAGIATAKRQTHDALVGQMGARRTGPVGWIVTSGPEALSVVEQATGAAGANLADVYAELRGLLVDQGGFLIIASAEGVDQL